MIIAILRLYWSPYKEELYKKIFKKNLKYLDFLFTKK